MKNLLLLSFVLFVSIGLQAQNTGVGGKTDTNSFFHNTTVEGQWFLGYQYGENGTDTVSAFTLKRGYLTVKQKFSKTFEARFTQDITLDNEGSDAGNIEMRLKYCYLKINLPDLAFFTSPFVELGLVHRPWIDFEEKINRYRVQGSMFLDRNKVISSADFGVTMVSLLGGKLDEKVRKNLKCSYPGKYGSLSFGVYNGGGYYAIEQNLNKILEGRLSLRPLPDYIPGLQFSIAQSYGKGNLESEPDYNASYGAISYECKYFNAVAQYYQGKGDFMGEYIDTLGVPTRNEGYSLFLEAKIPKTEISVIGRYDDFIQNLYGEKYSKRVIAGVAYNIFNDSKIVLDIDYLKKKGKPDSWMAELAIEIDF